MHVPTVKLNTTSYYSCLNACTYCKTKHARGDLGSYPIKEIVDRAEQSFKGFILNFVLLLPITRYVNCVHIMMLIIQCSMFRWYKYYKIKVIFNFIYDDYIYNDVSMMWVCMQECIYMCLTPCHIINLDLSPCRGSSRDLDDLWRHRSIRPWHWHWPSFITESPSSCCSRLCKSKIGYD